MKKNRFIRDTYKVKTAQKVLLKPLTWLYGLVMDVRNVLYDRSLINSYSACQYSISVGNLTVGGTGKTPMIEYLIQILKHDYRLVALSRGYGRKSRGFVLATLNTTASEIGDEPLQYYEKFGRYCPVAVSENRIKGSEVLHELFPEHTLLLLDDAYQHRAIRPDLSILLNDFNRPFYKDEPFPGGRLRENRHGAVRADVVVTTKCPENLDSEVKSEICRKIAHYTTQDTPCFFSSVTYDQIYSYENLEVEATRVVVVAGIAQPDPFIDHVKKTYSVSQVRIFPDHYIYTAADLEAILKMANSNDLILTTEKDKVKLRPLAREAGVLSKFAYLPIRVDFGLEAGRFQNWLVQHIESYRTTADGSH